MQWDNGGAKNVRLLGHYVLYPLNSCSSLDGTALEKRNQPPQSLPLKDTSVIGFVTFSPHPISEQERLRILRSEYTGI